eukprot:TRINITY_DN11924_c0_g2_i1.p1 TRINITY_DN11924_c0_g2~~TRINITY_DN11924_c0_g2_i1.p1  ORF type:complete len:347 (+),score=102.75 TRINITY_DN11924_c0_g2_i1:199-1239(+)
MAEEGAEQFDDFGFGFEEGNDEEQAEEENMGFGGDFDGDEDGFDDDVDGFGDGFDEGEAAPAEAEAATPTEAPKPAKPAKAAEPAKPKATEPEVEEYDGDPNVKPKAGTVEENKELRAHDQVGIKWTSFKGQVVNTLRVQIMPARVGFEQGYQSAMGKEVVIKPPKSKIATIIKKLKPNTEYVFRIVAVNDAGAGISAPTPPIRTCYYAPDRGDKSAWFKVIPDKKSGGGGMRTLGRRFSISKKRQDRYWLVLDGALLTWYKDIDGEEIGYSHLGKLREISYQQREDNTMFTLHYGEDSKLELIAISNHPTKTDVDIFKDWVQTITEVRRRLGGNSTQVVHKTVEK